MIEHQLGSDPDEPVPKQRDGQRRRTIVAIVAIVAAVLVMVVLVIVGSWLLTGRAAQVPAAAGGHPLPDASDTAMTDSPPASPSPSASSASPASSPSQKAPTAAPPAARPAGKPGPGNTGVPAGVKLTVINGDQVYETDNQVINGLDIHGFVKITARHVTIKNSIIRGGPRPRCNSAVVHVSQEVHEDASATLQDSEISPSNPSPCLDGMWVTNSTLTRMNIHGAVDGVKAFDNVTVQDSWIHDLSWFESDPNQGGGETHNDAVQSYEGNRHITLRHNTLALTSRDNATYQVTQNGGKTATDLHITDNWLDGGGCSLNFSHYGGPTPMTGIYVTGNRFGRGSYYQCPILVSTQTVLSQNSGNVWADTGKPIPPPDRHD